MRRKELFYYVTWGSNVTRDVHECVTVDYQQKANGNIANQIHGFTIDYDKFILISNSNWTEWSTIQGIMARVISKSDECEARGRFEITSTITPWIVRHEVQLLINRIIYNKFRI